MNRLILLGGVVAALATAVLQLLAALLDRSGRIRLRRWAEEAGGRVKGVYFRPADFEAFRFLLAAGAFLAPLLLLALLLAAGLPAWWAAGSTAALLVLCESTNRAVLALAAEGALRWGTFVYRPLLVAALPVLPLLGSLVPQPEDSDDGEEEEASEEEIEAFLHVGAEEGILEPGEEDLVLRIIDFGDALVKSVVTPRIDMVCAPVDSGLEELAELFLTCKHSRIPLYAESVDEIVGILHIRDLLGALRTAPSPKVRAVMNPPFFVPATKRLSDLLREMQARQQQMAIVVDEFGVTIGLVTIEDLVEEIVGEIADEHEDAPSAPQPAGDGVWRLDGGEEVDVLEELFGVDVEEEPYETVGGLVFGSLGEIPRAGQSVECFGVRLTVEEVEGRRVRTVLAERSAEESGGGA